MELLNIFTVPIDQSYHVSSTNNLKYSKINSCCLDNTLPEINFMNNYNDLKIFEKEYKKEEDEDEDEVSLSFDNLNEFNDIFIKNIINRDVSRAPSSKTNKLSEDFLESIERRQSLKNSQD